MPFGLSSGAGVIFGVSGGVTEAVLRRLVEDSGMEALNEIKFTGIRGTDGIKEAVIPYGDRQIKIAVVSGLKNADELIQKIKSGEVQYDFVEVMACRRGCMAGGGRKLPDMRGFIELMMLHRLNARMIIRLWGNFTKGF